MLCWNVGGTGRMVNKGNVVAIRGDWVGPITENLVSIGYLYQEWNRLCSSSITGRLSPWRRSDKQTNQA